ncbi:hypothetical protein MAIT1_00667 [Magnetofaba australis IT-1]|uniref:Uncharacterized protein n=1 Tax=Magnetofaba australis IT-1 TaxID=1434232 RepID=A0A1Y2JZ78_9PROT|nr:hypothetical protein MAIT1_00667 [Magnetofaba australis IT-1]
MDASVSRRRASASAMGSPASAWLARASQKGSPLVARGRVAPDSVDGAEVVVTGIDSIEHMIGDREAAAAVARGGGAQQATHGRRRQRAVVQSGAVGAHVAQTAQEGVRRGVLYVNALFVQPPFAASGPQLLHIVQGGEVGTAARRALPRAGAAPLLKRLRAQGGEGQMSAWIEQTDQLRQRAGQIGEPLERHAGDDEVKAGFERALLPIHGHELTPTRQSAQVRAGAVEHVGGDVGEQEVALRPAAQHRRAQKAGAAADLQHPRRVGQLQLLQLRVQLFGDVALGQRALVVAVGFGEGVGYALVAPGAPVGGRVEQLGHARVSKKRISVCAHWAARVKGNMWPPSAIQWLICGSSAHAP